MKTILVLAAFVLLLGSSAKAEMNRDQINAYNAIASVNADSVSGIAGAMGFKGSIPTDGPVTMTREFEGAESGSVGVEYMKTTYTVNLVMKNGKVAGIVATEDVQTKPVSYLSQSLAAVTHTKYDPQYTHAYSATLISKTFDPSAASQVAQLTKDAKSKGKAPASISSETGTKSNQIVSQNVQQNVQTTVSPSAP